MRAQTESRTFSAWHDNAHCHHHRHPHWPLIKYVQHVCARGVFDGCLRRRCTWSTCLSEPCALNFAVAYGSHGWHDAYVSKMRRNSTCIQTYVLWCNNIWIWKWDYRFPRIHNTCACVEKKDGTNRNTEVSIYSRLQTIKSVLICWSPIPVADTLTVFIYILQDCKGDNGVRWWLWSNIRRAVRKCDNTLFSSHSSSFVFVSLARKNYTAHNANSETRSGIYVLYMRPHIIYTIYIHTLQCVTINQNMWDF